MCVMSDMQTHNDDTRLGIARGIGGNMARKSTSNAKSTGRKSTRGTSRKSATTPTKVCTKTGIEYPATPEFFYRDKSQKDGLSPWSKDAERAYNKAYRAALSNAKTNRKGDIDTTTRSGKGRMTKFNKTMAPERVKRGRVTRKS